MLKKHFSKSLPQEIDPVSGRRPGERGIWQRRFWEHFIRDESDFDQHLAYIHENPVRHGYVTHPGDWRWSSYRYYRGRYRDAVQRFVGNPDGRFGERM